MAVNGCQWLSMAVNGCQWLSNGCQIVWEVHGTGYLGQPRGDCAPSHVSNRRCVRMSAAPAGTGEAKRKYNPFTPTDDDAIHEHLWVATPAASQVTGVSVREGVP